MKRIEQYKNSTEGFSVLEVVIASAIGLMAISAVLMVSLSDQSVGSDSEAGSDAIHIAQKLIEKAQADSRQDYSSVANSSASECLGALCYSTKVDIPASQVTQCSKGVVGSVAWTGDHGRPQGVTLATNVANVPEMLALGGTCDPTPPTGGWNPPSTYTCGRLTGSNKATALDVLNSIVYMTTSIAPYLYITDTNGAVYNPGCNNAQDVQFIAYDNGFDAGNTLNDVRVAKYSDGNIYAFIASDTATNQFRVYDVTDIHNPIFKAQRTLANVSPTGSYPEGWRIFYYNKRAYIVTKETAGNEFHVFDVSTPNIPGSIVELGPGYQLNRTVESLVITKKNISGTDRYYAYMATDKSNAEVTVLDVTNPSAITEITSPDQDLPGTKDGAAVYLLGDRLYVGRMAVAGGPEFYVFDASHPNTGLAKLSEADIGDDVIGLAISGPFAFLATGDANNEFKVWRSDPSNLTTINANFNFPNALIPNAVRYSNNFIYLLSQGNDALRILYSP